MKKLFPLTLMFVALTAKAQSCPDDNHPHMIDLGLPTGQTLTVMGMRKMMNLPISAATLPVLSTTLPT